MALKIESVEVNCSFYKAGLRRNDFLISIDGNMINNFVDLKFYSDPESKEIEYYRKNKKYKTKLPKGSVYGIESYPHNYKTCNNNCIFCFIDQLPPNLRKRLYIKDDDFLFSFAFGNFITLTNLSKRDENQILEQKLSPLYISIHSTNKKIRRKILRNKRDLDLLEKLEKFQKQKIQFHFQIVVIPKINDDKDLINSIDDLKKFKPLSIGIVPVGVTKFRENLQKIAPFDTKTAELVLKIAKKRKKVYCADEIFLKAKKKLPKIEYYDGFPQIENGIGLIVKAKKNWKENREKFLSFFEGQKKGIIFVCGEAAFEFIKKVTDQIEEKTKIKIETKKVENNFFGKSITVSGLLTAQDIVDQIKGKNKIICLPSTLFNYKGVTLDNVSKKKLKTLLKCEKLIVINELFNFWREIL